MNYLLQYLIQIRTAKHLMKWEAWNFIDFNFHFSIQYIIIEQSILTVHHPMTDLQYQTIPSQLEHKAHGKCICQLCNCGRHHKCPEPIKKGEYNSSYNADYHKYDDFKPEGKYKMIHKNFILPEDKFSGQSSYADDYNKKGAVKPDKFVPVGELTLSKEPFQANSSYIQDYLNRGQPQRAQKMQLPKNFVMPEGRFDGGSNYAENYIGGRTEKPEQFRPVGQLKTGGAFEGVSSYLADYENRGQGVKAERVPLPRNQVMPEGKFQGYTNYSANYVPTRSQKLQQFRPEGQLKLGGNFEGNSSYANDYNSKGAGQRAQRYPLPQNQVMPDGKFNGNSNYAENFVGNKAERPRQFRPEGQLKLGGDFKGQSSYLNDYANKGAAQRTERVMLPKNQVMPEGRFQGNTAYTSDYIGSNVSKNPQFRPVGELKVGEGRFQGNSSYANDYIGKGTPTKAQRVPLPRNQIMPEGKFEANSTYSGDYIPSQIKRQHCLCDDLNAPKIQATSKQHIRFNEKTHKWQ